MFLLHNLILLWQKILASRKFDDFNNGKEHFRKIQSGKMTLEEKIKKLYNVLKSNLNQISRRRKKSEEQKNALENIKLLYKSREAAFKFNDYYSIISQTYYKTIYRNRIPSMLAPVAKVSNLKVSYNSNLKISGPKQMIQRLPIAPSQVKAGSKSES